MNKSYAFECFRARQEAQSLILMFKNEYFKYYFY